MVGLTNTSSRKLFEESRGKIVPKSVFVGANSREAIARGRGEYIPVHLSRVPRLIREGSLRVDVALIQVSPPDEGGKVSLGSTAGSSLAAIEKARTVIAEINPHVPYTFGATQLPLAKIDYVVHSDKPLRTVDPPELGRTDRRIAKHILGLIPDEPTLQFGIGSTTDAVASLLADSGRNDLRIHSEMISDGTMRLMESGAVRGRAVYSFAMGSEKLLRWMHRNRRLKSQPSDVTNDPRRLAAIDRLVSINTALRVDLQGQINAQYVGDRPYSGVGGQQDFFRGAMMSEGGRAILALPSTSSVRDESGQQRLVSRIVLRLGEEDLVTSSMHDVQYVVTEYGAAHLEGKSEVGRAKELIRVAHPDFRADLRGELQQQLERRKQASHERERRASKQDEADS
jgi:4-hydroxybutyrate CoA-transferase